MVGQGHAERDQDTPNTSSIITNRSACRAKAFAKKSNITTKSGRRCLSERRIPGSVDFLKWSLSSKDACGNRHGLMESDGLKIARHEVDLGSTRVSYLDAGEGMPLVLVHGSVTTSELFRETIRCFARDYRVIAVDLRGYGASAKPGDGYTMQGFADDLAAFFDALDLSPAVLLGVSMGGFVAQLFALDHPGKLRALVLASTSDGTLGEAIDFSDVDVDMRQRGWQAVSSDLITGAFPPGTDPAIVNALLGRIGTWNETVIAGAIRSILEFDTRERLGEVEMPVQVMVGAHDQQLPVRLSEAMVAALPDAELVVFPDAGHFMMIETPQMFYDELSRFLQIQSGGELA